MYYPLIALNTAWGLPLQLLAWAGFGAALARRRPVDLLLLVMPVANYLMMGGVRVNQPRYFFLGMPFLLVLAAKLAGDGWRWARPRLPVRLGRVAGPALLVALLAWPMGMSLFQDYMLLQPDPRVVARAWFEANVPHGSRVVLDLGGPRLTESAESLVVHEGPPQGRFAELQREIFAAHNPAYWIASIRHHINGEAYREGREASVQPLAWYQAQGYEYIVLSTLVYDSYRHWPGVAERYPRTMAFYGQVAREAELLAEFEPVITDPRDFTATDLNPIPTVRVYRSPSVD
jgi:hypothetical protein